ncbi:unnamed protein product [Miscanthus lutarioriparius]|uniref:Protein FAR1-RELATED SEQUENCE n=1 Tax=Miscanthus lutarioriparius TaxID=422564 RepID=A0A811MKA0_9POAL|nr:unnamed protein product [Miscanthus lutarioriparius]
MTGFYCPQELVRVIPPLIASWISRGATMMEVGLNPGEELDFGGNQEDDDDAGSRPNFSSSPLAATPWSSQRSTHTSGHHEAIAAETVELSRRRIDYFSRRSSFESLCDWSPQEFAIPPLPPRSVVVVTGEAAQSGDDDGDTPQQGAGMVRRNRPDDGVEVLNLRRRVVVVVTGGATGRARRDCVHGIRRYALRTGFGVCVKKSSFTKAGLCRRLVLVCNKWGTGKEDACYQARPTAKTNCQATVVARLWVDNLLHLTDVNLEHNHALNPSAARFLRCYKTLPSGLSKDLVVRAARGECSVAGDIDVPIFDEWGRLKMGEADVVAINGFFAEMQAKLPNSFYVMDFYVEGHLRSVLWADSRSRAAYQYFSDAVWIDTTCLRNKYHVPLVSFLGINHHGQLVLLGCGLLSDESTESFLWLFRSWLTCMKERPPNAIVTDECVAIKAAVREVFPKTRHRISDWHVVRSISEKIGDLPEYEALRTDLVTVIYDSLIDSEFEARWKNWVDRFGLQDNAWIAFLYENRHLWAPAFLKDTFWAGLCTVSQHESPSTFFEDALSSETTLVTFLASYMTLLDNRYKMEQQDDFDSLNSSRVLISKYQMEEQLSRLYTLNMFMKFQDELKATMHCQVQLDGSASSFIVIDLTEAGSEMLNKKYEVVHYMATNRMECNCGLFQFSGIVCRHALSVLKWQQFLRLVEIGMTSDEKYRHAVRLLKDMKETLLDDNLCRDLEQKLTPAEHAIVNGDNHTQPGSSEGGPAKKRRGRPPKKNKEINVDSMVNQYGNKDSLLVSSDVTQKGAFHSASTTSNLGTHVRTHGIVDLMEEVHPSELSFDSRYGVQSGPSHHFGNQLNAGNTLQVILSGILCLDFGAARTSG